MRAAAQVTDLSIGDRTAEVTRPVYLPGYVTWEHQVGHHDPLTDVFSLGMILASLACGLDFADPEHLKRFVANRRNLFSLNPGLHPVLAQAISRMTEIDRHRRVQDLRALLHNLENYRDQEVDFEVDLARIPGFVQKDDRSKQHVVLGKLRERLFEISKRNRLLHFHATMQTVNLTHASVPLSFDITNIRPDQILVWNDSLHAALTGGEPISLNKYLNFAEALYLPSMLDRIMAESRRDQAEFGFGQLRLVICFLHWANLKEKPVERFDSPLVLLPVELKKKKGIRDTYYLEAVSSEAEVNPVVRHQFKQLYDIDLPEVIDLAATNLDQFFDYLAQKIAASEPAVTLNKVDRPRIELIHDKARRKLDQYRRRARLAGRGIRSFQDLDYSYDQANYHPLGITLFSAKIRPPATHLRTVIEEKPRPRSFATAEPEPPAAEKERLLYHLQEGGEENPYVWNFDLCSVTLGNFKYRKMSLVRDYETLLDNPPTNPAFDATFSLAPRATERQLPPAVPLDERYHVVPSDPTQASAIEEARAGTSYIIQGPPGTGKSQTITNLIADYVARGKRVLFVCEKRAAIDVVYARLRQCGLGDLCCLIHDSQTDKKGFVMDLKQTYEGLLAEAGSTATAKKNPRKDLLNRLKNELRPLEHFDAAMQGSPQHVGIPLRQLLRRGIELRARTAGTFAPGARAPARLCHVVAPSRADRLAGGDRPGHPPRRHPGQAPAAAIVAAVGPGRSAVGTHYGRAPGRGKTLRGRRGELGAVRSAARAVANAGHGPLAGGLCQAGLAGRAGREDGPAGPRQRGGPAVCRGRNGGSAASRRPWPRPGRRPRPGGRSSRRRKCRSPSSRRRRSSRASLHGCGPRGGDCGGFSTTRTTSARTWFARAGRRCSAHSRRNTRNWTSWTGSGRRSPSSSGSTATSTA